MFNIVGGGITVPALLPLLPVIGVPSSELIFMAMGTSFATMIISTSGAGLIVPFFNKTGLTIKKAIGTAAFCGVFLTLFAAIGFIISGLSYDNLPPYSLGFIHLPTVAIVSLLSVPMSKIGVKLMLKLSDTHLKRYFALFLIALSLYMTFMAVKSLVG